MITPSLVDLDRQLVSPEYYADPYPFYARLRVEAPVHWSDTLGGWMVTRYDDVLSTLRDTDHFSNQGRFHAVLNPFPPEVRARLQAFDDHFAVGLIGSDPPDHTRLRGLVNLSLTPRIVDRLRPRVQALVDTFLDAVQEQGRMDVIRDLAYPLPATVIAELLGVPPSDRDRFKLWSEGIFAFQGTGRATPELVEYAQTHLLAMRAFLSELLAERRLNPRDDLLTRLVEAEAAGARLTESELLTTCVTLLTAGHETTTNLIGNGLLLLLRHPDQLGLMRDNPRLLPSAIEECLRYESPLQRNPRRVKEDVELRGQRLRRGDYVMQILGSANRDPVRFSDPDRFDIARAAGGHVAFGFGIHFCVGAPLARLEAPIAIHTILRRFPRLALATDRPEWHHHGLLRGLKALPVTF